MTVLEQICEAFPDDTFIKADGYDEAIIGLDASETPYRLVYDRDKAILVTKAQMGEDCDEEDAWEYFEFNVEGSKGAGYPLWVTTFQPTK